MSSFKEDLHVFVYLNPR